MPFNLPVTIIAIRDYITNSLATLSADTLGWLSVIVLHCATLPSFLALMTGLSDKTPGLDMIFFLWSGLILLFLRAVVLRDMLNIITIGFGFILQAGFMALILFK
ncbi:MAG: hypothetical protein EBU08_09550 [Micrococcales bacterium]|jgi:hypothetical protein|nr:hypothetical protein [Micrococcales bacterium]